MKRLLPILLLLSCSAFAQLPANVKQAEAHACDLISIFSQHANRGGDFVTGEDAQDAKLLHDGCDALLASTTLQQVKQNALKLQNVVNSIPTAWHKKHLDEIKSAIQAVIKAAQ